MSDSNPQIRNDNRDQGWTTKKGAPRWSVSTAQDAQYWIDVVSDFQHTFSPVEQDGSFYGSSEVINGYLAASFNAHFMYMSLFGSREHYFKGFTRAYGYKGSYKKAEGFTAVWTSLIFMDLFGVYSPDDPSIEGIARTLSDRMSAVNHKKTYTHIRNYLTQKRSSPLHAWFYSYLWSLEALGHGINFRKIPTPIGDVTSLVENRILKPDELLLPDQLAHLAQSYKSWFESAAETFTKKEEFRKTNLGE
jgi:hypothetical protein